MQTCLKSNFSKDEFSGILDIKNLKSNNVGSLINEIYDRLKGSVPFSLSKLESKDSDNYIESIEELADTLIEKLSQEALNFEFNENSQDSFRELLINKLSPKFNNKVEEQVSAIIEGTDLISNLERKSIELKDLLKSLYNTNNLGIDKLRETRFLDLINKITIIDTDKKLIIDSDIKLNQGIINYLNEQFKIIVRYLLDKYKIEGIPNYLYTTDPETGVQKRIGTYNNVLNALFNIISYKQEKGILLSELEDGWALSLENKDMTLYDVISAYINLVYFDLIIDDKLGDLININNNYDNPITLEYIDGEKVYINKYTLKQGNINNRKNFGVELQDSLDGLSKFSKSIILAIPLYEYTTKSKEWGNLDARDFILTWTKLKSIGTKISNTEFNKAILALNSNDPNAVLEIFRLLFRKEHNSTLLNQLNNLGFDHNNLNVLYSVYHTVFDISNRRSDSWLAIENAYLRKTGVRSRYNLAETLQGLIVSNTAMNYLLTIYNSNEEQYVTKVKEMFSITGVKFDTIRNINKSNVKENVDSKLFLLETHANKHDYSVTINNTKYDIILTDTAKGVHLLNFSKPIKNFQISNLNDLNVDISTLQQRDKIIEGTGLTEDEKKFKDILNFIDTMLYTTFGKSSEGLYELYMSLKLQDTFLNELFLSSTRALVVLDIYSLFNKEREEKDENGNNKYSVNQLKKFLKDRGTSIYTINLGDLTLKEDSSLFFRELNGLQLRTVGNNEEWLTTYAKVKTIISGETSKSVTTNLEGSKIPNSSPTFLGSDDIKTQIYRTNFRERSAANLLFSKSLKAIIDTVVNTDVRLADGTTKAIKDMSEGELLYDAIVNKFLNVFTEEGNIYTSPTTLSDKTKFVLGYISLDNINIGNNTLKQLITRPDLEKYIVTAMIDTIGNSYKSIWNEVLNDYRLLFGNISELEIAKKLSQMSEKDLNNLVNNYNKKNKTNLVLYRDLHFRVIKDKKLAFNELLYEFANNLYTENNLKTRLKKEKRNFINDLLRTRTHFKLTGLLEKSFNKFVSNPDSWRQEDYAILAKVKDTKTGKERNVVTGVIKDSEVILQINPMLNAYFLIDNLIGNNLRFSMTGSEINHKVKSLAKLDLKSLIINIKLLEEINPELKKSNLSFYDLYTTILLFNLKFPDGKPNNMTEDKWNELIEVFTRLLTVYENRIYNIENQGQNALFKRNVIIPATMTKMIPNIQGITRTMNIACIDDVKADVFNFDGKEDGIDAHDGSALISPIWSILENKSLNDSEVGTIKKPILHFYNDKYMTATLLKYATDTFTNLWIRLAEGNDLNNNKKGIVIRNIFKKMHNKRWTNENGEWVYGPVDLINGCSFRKGRERISFLEDICEGTKLYYRKGIDHILIEELGREKNVYYTIESLVDEAGNPINDSVKIYHYFDNNGNHIPSTTIRFDDNLHTIDSLYELHTVLGGIYSESLNKNGVLQYSEASNYAVALYAIHVANLKENGNPDKIDIDNYDLPLKQAMIHVIANNSAVKNGAGNVNSSSSWYDDTELSYMTIGTENYGILQDSDHTADEAHMTEFSQVISSLDAGGYLHDYVSEIYKLLGLVAIDLSQIEIDSVNEFRKTGNKNALYDIIGRTIINNFRNDRSQAGLAEAILSKVKETFNIDTDHLLNKFKVPFSDPNIYSSILSTFVSNINKKSIKRQYPGLGTVMVPAYDLSMIFDFDGQTYLYEDLINMAYEAGFDSNNLDVSERNREVVKQFLQSKQLEQEEKSIEDFMPTDNVLVSFTGEKFNTSALNLNDVEYEIIDKKWKKDPTKSNKALEIYIKGHKELGSFELVKDNEYGYYSVHFKTGNPDTGETYGSTPELRNILYENLYSVIPEGALVSTYGEVSKGGLYALNKLMNEYIGDIKVDNIEGLRLVVDREGNPVEIPVFRKFGSGISNYEELTTLLEHIRLNKILDYYSFKADPVAYLLKLGYINVSNIKLYKDVTQARNLAPAKVSWTYYIGNEKHSMNIFDHWRVKLLFLEISKIDDLDVSNSRKKELINLARKKFDIELAFREINNGYYIDEAGNRYEVKDLLNSAAEMIMSNIYKSTFNITDGDSLVDIMNEGASYFEIELDIIDSSNYDIVFTNNNNKHLYLTFKPIPRESETFDPTRVKFNIIRKKYEQNKDVKYTLDKKIVNRLYAVTKDNILLFEIGREIIRDDITYDAQKNEFYLDGLVLKKGRYRYLSDLNKVLETVYFVSQYNVTETKEDSTNKYTLYNINKNAIKRAFDLREYSKEELEREDYTLTPELKFDEEINNYISSLLADIYLSNDFGGIQVNSKMTELSGAIVTKVIKRLSNKLNYDLELSNYLSLLGDLLELVKPSNYLFTINKRILRNLNKEYNQTIQLRKYVSFLKSQSFTVSRIPALTLLSFMKMKNVGFTGVSTGLCFVSHWQTWLQGSDYDIDKAYIMGLSFDANGKYIGWSNLFKYNSLEELEASEYLPAPLKVEHVVSLNGLNIDNYLSNIASIDSEILKLIKQISDSKKLKRPQEEIDSLNSLLIKYKAKRILSYSTLLKAINKNTYKETDNLGKEHTIAKIFYTQPNGEEIVKLLRSHEFTKIPPTMLQESNKNFVSSHILNTILNLVNMVRAYSPIEMEDFRDASSLSIKGEQASKMTLMNPTTKFLMQYSNMVGKNVIGIAANGEKASFMWHYYLNDIIHNNPTGEKLNLAKFFFKTNRIVGRASNNMLTVEINTLPDINIAGVDTKIVNSLGVRLNSLMPVDLLISLVLSAATDNAKELILAKVNAGTKLAKMYLFLISLGVNINDIVKFMTSDTASFIDLITEENIFDSVKVKMEDAIEMAKGNFSKIYNKKYGKFIMNEIKELYESSNISKEEFKKEAELDAIEFANVLEGANEFSNLGRLLGLNLGLPTSKMDLHKSIEFIQSILKTRIDETLKLPNLDKDFKKELENIEPLDVKRWLSDKTYREEIKQLYNKVKKVVNVFDVFESIALFDAIREIYSAVVEIDHNISLKSKGYDLIHEQMKKDGFIVKEDYAKSILNEIDKVIINKFIKSLNLQIPITTEMKYFTPLALIESFKENNLFGVNTVSSIASFKYIFENYIIPGLLKGYFYSYKDGKVIKNDLDELNNNKFILSLLNVTNHNDIPIYKSNLNMMTIESSIDSQRKFLNYSKGLQLLSTSKYKISDKSDLTIADLFMLYNLIVNKNLYGLDKFTALFDTFITNTQLARILYKYFKYLGELDYYSNVSLNTGLPIERDKSLKYSLELNYLDILLSAARTVFTSKGLTDPFIVVNNDDGPELLKRNSNGTYSKVRGILTRLKGENTDNYLERVSNFKGYFVLGNINSEILDRQINEIANLDNNALNYINDFIQRGLLTIQKICE